MWFPLLSAKACCYSHKPFKTQLVMLCSYTKPQDLSYSTRFNHQRKHFASFVSVIVLENEGKHPCKSLWQNQLGQCSSVLSPLQGSLSQSHDGSVTLKIQAANGVGVHLIREHCNFTPTGPYQHRARVSKTRGGTATKESSFRIAWVLCWKISSVWVIKIYRHYRHITSQRRQQVGSRIFL